MFLQGVSAEPRWTRSLAPTASGDCCATLPSQKSNKERTKADVGHDRRGPQTLCKGTASKYSTGFGSHKASAPTTELRHHGAKAATDYIETKKWGAMF